MKRFLVLMILGVLIFCPAVVLATPTAMTVVPSKITVNNAVERVTLKITATADASDASFATLTINPDTYGIRGWYLYDASGLPGTPGPTNGAWDIDLTDAVTTYLVSQNLLDNLSSTTPFEVVFNAPFRMIKNNWTLSIGDNAVNSATFTLYLTFTSK